MPCGFTTPLSCELRRLGFSLPLHCSALFNHGQVTPFIVFIAAFGRFMRRSRIPKHSRRHIYSRCEVRSCGAVAGARTLGVNFKGRMGAGNPLSPRHADSIRAACKLRSLRNTVRDLRTREAAIHIVAVELVLNQPSSCKDRESALAGRFVCCTLQTCRRQLQNIIQRPKSPLEHREAAERECARAEGVGLAEGKPEPRSGRKGTRGSPNARS